MKKLISLILIFALCFSTLAVAASAEGEEIGKSITSVELHNVKYYAAVRAEEEVKDAAFFIDFVAYFDDGTTAEYNSKNGWDDETVTAEVSWYIQPEEDDNFGSQQSLYVTIDGRDFWAGYTKVEVNKWKALLRTIVTWDWVTPEVIETASIIVITAFIIHIVCEWIRDTVILGLLGVILTPAPSPAPAPVTE